MQNLITIKGVEFSFDKGETENLTIIKWISFAITLYVESVNDNLQLGSNNSYNAILSV